MAQALSPMRVSLWPFMGREGSNPSPGAKSIGLFRQFSCVLMAKGLLLGCKVFAWFFDLQLRLNRRISALNRFACRSGGAMVGQGFD